MCDRLLWDCEKCGETCTGIKRPEDGLCHDCRGESAGFLHETRRLRKIFREGLIHKSEYLLQMINLCTNELAMETQDLMEDRHKLDRIKKEMR
jgi:hypothetical protein